MSESIASLRRKISSSGDLQSVVRTMKALAAASIGQCENSVLALSDYYRTVALGLGACLRQLGPEALRVHQASQIAAESTERSRSRPSGAEVIGAVVFGSDQGLVGQFNEVVVDFASEYLAKRGSRSKLWVVGERTDARLLDGGLTPIKRLPVPSAIPAVAPLVGEILMQCEAQQSQGGIDELHVFYNRPTGGAGYAPIHRQLLPLDHGWLQELINVAWPTSNVAEVLGDTGSTLRALTHEFLFISLFRACAESMASENASRLATMQRADKNIHELLEHLRESFHRLRQGRIDEELFDIVSGFEALGD